jgi:uncharacterized membrane protein
MRINVAFRHCVILLALTSASTGIKADTLVGTLTNVSSISVPGNNFTVAYGIDNLGEVSGSFRSNAPSAPEEGFLLKDGVFNIVAVPGFSETGVQGLNDVGQLVGAAFTNPGNFQAFEDDNGHFTLLNLPGSVNSAAFGINNLGQTVGYFTDLTGAQHGFVCTSVKCSQIDIPGASNTDALGINNKGQVVGWYLNNDGYFGFVDDLPSGTITTFGTPGSKMTLAIGINDLGQVVGQTDVTQDGALKNEGFLFSNFSTELFLLPNSSSTELLGINNTGQVVGLADREAFEAQVPEPSALLLFGTAALLGLAIVAIRFAQLKGATG